MLGRVAGEPAAAQKMDAVPGGPPAPRMAGRGGADKAKAMQKGVGGGAAEGMGNALGDQFRGLGRQKDAKAAFGIMEGAPGSTEKGRW